MSADDMISYVENPKDPTYVKKKKPVRTNGRIE